MMLDKEYFARLEKVPNFERSHKEMLIENFRPIAKMGVSLELQAFKTAIYWNTSSFTEIEKFTAWNLVVSSSRFSSGQLALFLATKLKYDAIQVEGEHVRIIFGPGQGMIVDVPLDVLYKGLSLVERTAEEYKLLTYLEKHKCKPNVANTAKIKVMSEKMLERLRAKEVEVKKEANKEAIMFAWRDHTSQKVMVRETKRLKNYELEHGLIG